MTAREWLEENYSLMVGEEHAGGCVSCPHTYPGINLDNPEWCTYGNVDEDCRRCWDREIPEDKSDMLNREINVTPSEEDNKYHYVVDWSKVRGICCNGEDYKVGDVVTKIPKYEHRGEPIADVIGIKEAEEGVATVTIKPLNRPYIKDSGNRREFETGAVRDIQEGKGRCDLMPLDVVGRALDDRIIKSIHSFVDGGDERLLYCTLSLFNEKVGYDKYTLLLEVSKHFEEGAKKYGENNWQKGIPTHCYIDSAVRHYLKFLRGDKDEPHDRAFVWNILCCIWTCKHKPELNDYADKNGEATE